MQYLETKKPKFSTPWPHHPAQTGFKTKKSIQIMVRITAEKELDAVPVMVQCFDNEVEFLTALAQKRERVIEVSYLKLSDNMVSDYGSDNF